MVDVDLGDPVAALEEQVTPLVALVGYVASLPPTERAHALIRLQSTHDVLVRTLEILSRTIGAL